MLQWFCWYLSYDSCTYFTRFRLWAHKHFVRSIPAPYCQLFPGDSFTSHLKSQVNAVYWFQCYNDFADIYHMTAARILQGLDYGLINTLWDRYQLLTASCSRGTHLPATWSQPRHRSPISIQIGIATTLYLPRIYDKSTLIRTLLKSTLRQHGGLVIIRLIWFLRNRCG